MRIKPLGFNVLALFLLGVAVSFPIQVAMIYGHGLSEWSAVSAKLTWLNWLVIGLCLFNALASYHASPILRVTIPVALVAVAWNNWIVGVWGHDFPQWSTASATLIFVLMNGILLVPSCQQAFRNPRKQWWRSRPRSPIQVPVWVETRDKTSFLAKTFDVSRSGAFIPFVEMGKGQSSVLGFPTPVMPGEEVQLRLNLPDDQECHCRAQVIRKSRSEGGYPGGMGIRFREMDRRSQRALRRFLSKYVQSVI